VRVKVLDHRPAIANSRAAFAKPKNNGSEMEPLPPRRVPFIRTTGEIEMVRKVMTVVAIGASLALAACNTVRGAAADVNSAANAVDNAV